MSNKQQTFGVFLDEEQMSEHDIIIPAPIEIFTSLDSALSYIHSSKLCMYETTKVRLALQINQYHWVVIRVYDMFELVQV